ncbi:MAG: GtrA family protein [Anaerovibrio sp.]
MEAILADRKNDYSSSDCKPYKNWQELLRYGLAGGLSFGADFCLLYVMREYIFTGYAGVYWATLAGFLGGLAVNTFLSVRYVFRAPAVVADRRGRNVRDMAGIVLIGVAGLLLTELGMYAGVDLLQVDYLLVKLVVTVIVFLWNYLGRKLLVFKADGVIRVKVEEETAR